MVAHAAVHADSLTEGIFNAILSLLSHSILQGEPPLFSASYGLGSISWKEAIGPQIHHTNLTLRMDHPLSQRLLKRHEHGDAILKEIPRWRFEEPIIRFWRNDNLADEKEMSAIILQKMGVVCNQTY